MRLKLIEKTEFDRVRPKGKENHLFLQLYADMCRYNTLVSVKKAGSGHLGTSFSAMDIVTYLYLSELNVLDVGINSPDRDIYFSSKGHDVPGLYSFFYSVGILSEDDILKLRRFGGLDGHPDVSIPGIEANTGSLGMGISKGRGMAIAKKYLGQKGRVFVLTGDGEFQEGQIYESLQATAHQKVTNLTVIIDRNKFQTDMLVNDVNSIDDLATKVSAFGWFVTYCNGHNYRDLERTFEMIKEVNDKPKFIIADTIKGKGVSIFENYEKDETGRILYRWHSGAPSDEHYSIAEEELRNRINSLAKELGLNEIHFKELPEETKVPSNVSQEFVKNAFGEALCEIAETRKDFIVIDGDLSADCGLRKFEYKYPERFIENGIAEQDMTSLAGGLARMGLLPVVSSFSSFLTSRANEQIYNNACEKTKIIYACHFAGILPAGPGKSHQSVRDISLLGAIPNMIIVEPCNSIETKQVVDFCVNEADVNCAIRLIIGPSPRIIELPQNYKLELGKGTVLKEGTDAIIFAYGPVMLHEALLASELLETKGFSLMVVNMPWLNRVDNHWLESVTKKHSKIFVLEDHSNFGGLGDLLLNNITKIKKQEYFSFERFGLDEYPVCGTPPEVLGYHKLDGKSLAERITGEKYDIKITDRFTVDAPQ
ncbi:MAG: 1-deoxy-D-xylulose-5-phosphate synthase [Candidatus Kapabacteria bacterium]|nr:1-deoxy-D-xylulose-5-phosphate synthase [Candidatus Kapabacteria bacterium]